jgi:hypothetical protein
LLSTPYPVKKKYQGDIKKRLKIPKEQSEGVNQRSTDNIMAKRKSTTEQKIAYETRHRKPKIGGELRRSDRVSRVHSTYANIFKNR